MHVAIKIYRLTFELPATIAELRLLAHIPGIAASVAWWKPAARHGADSHTPLVVQIPVQHPLFCQ